MLDFFYVPIATGTHRRAVGDGRICCDTTVHPIVKADIKCCAHGRNLSLLLHTSNALLWSNHCIVSGHAQQDEWREYPMRYLNKQNNISDSFVGRPLSTGRIIMSIDVCCIHKLYQQSTHPEMDGDIAWMSYNTPHCRSCQYFLDKREENVRDTVYYFGSIKIKGTVPVQKRTTFLPSLMNIDCARTE
ncbi:hypothetical protein BJV82DRAFT_230340 [Fennellomyces sp. T-0311]|nr:hypothetical protein BJV82DRAFT_230340 [Fennellomyces sp. T-0311]